MTDENGVFEKMEKTAECVLNAPEAEWGVHAAAGMMANAESTQRQVEDSVLAAINALPEKQRDEIHLAVENGTAQKHPVFVHILQRVHSELHKNPPSAPTTNTTTPSQPSKNSSMTIDN